MSQHFPQNIASKSLTVRHFGIEPYKPVWRAMQSFTHNRTQQTKDEIWLLQHQPVFTQGQAGKAEHVLTPGDIPVVQVDRGGQVTYHGPGQLVAYIFIDLARNKLGIRDLVTALETVLIATLAEFGVLAHARADAPGVYVGDRKIASLGLKVNREKSYHGLSLNVLGNMEPFRRINPCGYSGLEMVKLEELAPGASIDAVSTKLLNHLMLLLGYGIRKDAPGFPP